MRLLRLTLTSILLAIGCGPQTISAIWIAEDLGGALDSTPSVVADGESRQVFYRGSNGQLWRVARRLDGAWGSHQDLAIPISSAPSAVSTGIERMRVFYRGTNGHLVSVEFDGSWKPPVSLGIPIDSAPSAVRTSDGALAVFYRGADLGLYGVRSEEGWYPEKIADLDLSSAPSASLIYGSKRKIRVAFSSAGTLWSVEFDGQKWGAPIDSEQSISSAPSAVSWAPKEVDVFYAQGEDLVLRSRDSMIQTGIKLGSGPSARDASEVYYRGTNGHLWRARPQKDAVYPKFPEVFGIATHNSYWINRRRWLDPFSTGTQELLLDQLLHERVRALEIDVHTDNDRPGMWRVYHTLRRDYSQVATLQDLLHQLRLFHYVLPRHEVINIFIELKNTELDWWKFPRSKNNFRSTHTIEQFDRIFRDGLGESLYTPHDLLSRCAPGSTLRRAGAVGAWPTTDELRGKFMINILGNWSNAAYDWVKYAGEGNIADRVCFPVRCIFDAAGDGIPGQWPGSTHDKISPETEKRARDASVFWQVEHLDYAEVPKFLAEGGVVRGADSFPLPEQQDRLRRGFHFLQTDYPWFILGGTGNFGLPSEPYQRLRDASWVTGKQALDPAALVEPGIRLHASTGSAPAFASTSVSASGSQRWETAVSTTRIGNPYGKSFPRRAQEGGIGGIRAAAGPSDYLEVLRVKTGGSGDGWHQERLKIVVRVARGGAVQTFEFAASATTSDAVGNLIALAVENQGTGAVVRAYSAGRVTPHGHPVWTLLRQESFSQPCTKQGLVFTKDVLFVGVRATQNGNPLPPGLALSPGATLIDLSR